MKKFLSLAFIGSVLFSNSQTVSPVPNSTSRLFCMDVFAVAPYSLKGAGGGMGVFSPSFLSEKEGVELRFGGDFYFSGLERFIVRDVPLAAPQTGLAKIKLSQSLMAFNAAARISLPLSERVSPYLDGFAGFRGITTDITITPYEYKIGYEKTSTDNLSTVFRFHYGVGFGLLTRLGKEVRLNTGILYSYTPSPGSTYDIYSANAEKGSLQMKNTDISKGMIVFKLGISGLFDGKSNDNNCDCCEKQQRRGGGTITPRASSGGLKSNRISTGTKVMK